MNHRDIIVSQALLLLGYSCTGSARTRPSHTSVLEHLTRANTPYCVSECEGGYRVTNREYGVICGLAKTREHFSGVKGWVAQDEHGIVESIDTSLLRPQHSSDGSRHWWFYGDGDLSTGAGIKEHLARVLHAFGVDIGQAVDDGMLSPAIAKRVTGERYYRNDMRYVGGR